MIAKNLLIHIATILFAFAIPNATAEFDVATYCLLVPRGTRMPSFNSCQTFYTCQGDGIQPTVGTCANTQSFDVNTQSCRASSSVNCFYGDTNPCVNQNNAFVPIANNCQGWIYCSNGKEVRRDNCPAGQIFDARTSSCIFGTCNTDVPNNGFNPVGNVCDIMQTGTFFGSIEDCTQWNKCNTNNIVQSGNCDPNLVYNVERRMCLRNDGTMCARTNGEAPSPPREPCNADANGNLVADANVCSIFYQCDGTNWVRSTCTTGNYFDVTLGRCLTRRAATPQSGCNRCQFATTTWVNAVDEECQEYYTCRDGSRVNTAVCPNEEFFNEQRQVCNPIRVRPAYVKTNGACAAAPVTEEPVTEEPVPEPPGPAK